MRDFKINFLLVIKEYTLAVVHQYMYHIRANAESCVRQLLRDVAQRAGTNVLEAKDYLDDGSPVRSPSCVPHPFFTVRLGLDTASCGNQQGGGLCRTRLRRHRS